MAMHLYVYNECSKPISATAGFTDVDTGQSASRTVSVLPGHQTMLCVTDHSAVSCAAVSVDGTLHWAEKSFELTGLEYTHVITCQCDGPGCPLQWPSPTTRQSPDEEG